MTLLTRLTPHQQPLCATALILLMALCASVLHGWSSLEARHTQLDRLGHTLANSAAQRAADATINQDMISLQAVLQELARDPQVVGATVHDVENRLLVQSGFAPDAQDRGYHHYSAPVALADNIAGYLQLVLASPSLDASDYRFFALLWLVAGLTATVPWWPPLHHPRLIVTPSQTDAQTPKAQLDDEPATETGPSEPPPPTTARRLQLELINLHTLSEQINQEHFDQLLERFQHQLRSVLSLYGGHWLAMVDQTLLLEFRGEHNSDCAFRALCSAQLLSELCQLNAGPRLKLQARVYPCLEAGAPIADLRVASGARPVSSPGIAIDPPLIDSELSKQLELNTDSGALLAVRPPYRQLLDRQREQLQALAVPPAS